MAAANKWVAAFEEGKKKEKIAEFHIGDTIRVLTKIVEGEKERNQAFQGTVIARKGQGLTETISVHRISFGVGIERIFYLHSPRLIEIQVIKRGDVRRAKLYYLRTRKGKAAKVLEKIGPSKTAAEEAPVKAEEPAARESTEA